MTIQNQTRKTTIANSIIIPTSLLDQTLGLLKHKTPVAMLFKTRFGIHTFFMKYAIDVLVLDKENRVVTIKEFLKPNQIFIWNSRHSTIIELPQGTIKLTKTKLGDRLKIDYLSS